MSGPDEPQPGDMFEVIRRGISLIPCDGASSKDVRKLYIIGLDNEERVVIHQGGILVFVRSSLVSAIHTLWLHPEHGYLATGRTVKEWGRKL